jgi:hypothetical protein
VRQSSGVSGEERHGVGAIPAREGRKLDQTGRGASRGGEGALEGWNLGGVEQPWRNPVRSSTVGSVVARGQKRKSSEEDGVRVKLYRRALLRRREGEQAQGRAQVGERCRHALRVCVAAARDQRPDVAGRREASGGGAGGGRGSKATCGRGEGGAGLQRLGKRPAAMVHARAAETKEVGDPRTDLQNLKSVGTPL